MVEVRPRRRETGRPRGEARKAGSGGEGEAQSEGPKEERQSGVVKVDSSLRGEVHEQVGRGRGV
jgi:hypothetical protein